MFYIFWNHIWLICEFSARTGRFYGNSLGIDCYAVFPDGQENATRRILYLFYFTLSKFFVVKMWFFGISVIRIWVTESHNSTPWRENATNFKLQTKPSAVSENQRKQLGVFSCRDPCGRHQFIALCMRMLQWSVRLLDSRSTGGLFEVAKRNADKEQTEEWKPWLILDHLANRMLRWLLLTMSLINDIPCR